jgi:hypothetical protein
MMTMAASRIFLAAHHDDRSIRGVREELSHAILIERLSCHRAVVDVSLTYDAVPVTGWVIGATAKRAPCPDVLDTRVVKGGPERTAAEMRSMPAIWSTTDIDEGLHPVVSQQSEE